VRTGSGWQLVWMESDCTGGDARCRELGEGHWRWVSVGCYLASGKADAKVRWKPTQLCDLLQPGSHGTTYGGTPLACAVSLAVLQTIEDDHLVERAAKLGRFATGQIKKIRGVREVRGQGLMIGIDLDPELVSQPSPGKTVAQRWLTR